MTLTEKDLRFFYLSSLLFLLWEALSLYTCFYPGFLLPVGLFFLFLAYHRLDLFYLSMVFFVPLSVSLQEFFPDLDFNLSIPSELFMLLILFVLLYRYLLAGGVEKRFLYHPVTLTMLIYLGWMLVTAVTSTLPWVSFKFFFAHVWFIASGYFLAWEVFRADSRNRILFVWAYMLALLLVVLYTVFNQSTAGLVNQKAAHAAMKPFYNDHTSYGAMLALFLPVAVFFLFRSRRERLMPRWLVAGITPVFFFGFVFSYSRAAWLSLTLAAGVALLIRLKIRFRTILLFALLIGGILLSSWTTLWMKLEENKQESSTSFAQHIISMTNIRSDASNLERINRWKCAWRMFREKPLTGWGPGTYMFQYAPFQLSYDRTIISTDFGDMGTAHSEYLGPLSESGLPGFLSITALFVVAFLTGVKVYRHGTTPFDRSLALALTTGLTSYFIHGMMNNFLERDKAAIPFWGFLALLVVMDLACTPSPAEKKNLKEFHP